MTDYLACSSLSLSLFDLVLISCLHHQFAPTNSRLCWFEGRLGSNLTKLLRFSSLLLRLDQPWTQLPIKTLCFFSLFIQSSRPPIRRSGSATIPKTSSILLETLLSESRNFLTLFLKHALCYYSGRIRGRFLRLCFVLSSLVFSSSGLVFFFLSSSKYLVSLSLDLRLLPVRLLISSTVTFDKAATFHLPSATSKFKPQMARRRITR